MSFAKKLQGGPVRTCECRVCGLFMPTKPGLAYTPSDMIRLAERGIPVSSQASSDFYDGSLNPSWSVPMERTRGVDVSDMWEAQQESRAKIRNAQRNDVKKYGKTPEKNE